MTNEQFEKYKKIDEEVKDIKMFCWWCGKKYKEKSVSKPPFNLITKGKKLLFHKIYYNTPKKENTYNIPYDLQKRIIQVVEDYLDEKEEELKSI